MDDRTSKKRLDLLPRKLKLPDGECRYCDQMRQNGIDWHPPHDASKRCESGKRPHCTCDFCW